MRIELLFSLLGLISPFLIFWITLKVNQDKKLRNEMEEIKKELVDLKLEIVKLESDKVSKEHLNKLLSDITTKIDYSNEKLNKLLGHIENKGGVI